LNNFSAIVYGPFTLTNNRRKLLIAGLTLVLTLAALLLPAPGLASAPQSRTIEITVRTFAFEPSMLAVQAGDTVTIHLESLDAQHGFSIDGYPVDIHAEPGKSTQVTFVADRSGKFKFRCSVTCGPLHPFMAGELIITPDWLWARAAVAALIAAAGTAAFFWIREPKACLAHPT
jgi:heme/copper-type cytochrome/quinol oxidase subunit 2